jgi:hypothetical protein
MSDLYQKRARALVIVGFALNIVAALVDLINVYGDGLYKHINFSGMLGLFLDPLVALAATGAWWFLTKVTPESTAQRSLLGKAMYWFGLEIILGVVESVNIGLHQSITTWTGSIIWIMAIGGAIEAVGLISLARVLDTMKVNDGEIREPLVD